MTDEQSAARHPPHASVAPCRMLWLLPLILFLLQGGPAGWGSSPLESIPLNRSDKTERKQGDTPTLPLFKQMAAENTGITMAHRFPSHGTLEALQDQRSGAGVAIGDYDQDGNPDIYISNYDQGNRLYRNLGNWRFEDVTRAAGVGGEGRWCSGVTFVDLDNDGDLDLFVAVFGAANWVYINQGNGRFRDEAKERGLDFAGASVMMAFADFDRDGDLDGYLVTARRSMDSSHHLPNSGREAVQRGIIRLGRNGEIHIPPAYQDLFGTLAKPNGRTELIIAGQPDRFYRNNGRGEFVEVSREAGIEGQDIGLAATWWDYNEDGFPDLYVSNDYKGPDRLYRNREGKRFEEVTRPALPAVPYASMGSDVADVNNDGRLDFLATDMAGTTREREVMNYSDLARDIWFLQTAEPRQYRRNMLFINTGTERFLEAAHLAQVASSDWTWSPKFADLDNDGWIDLFIANGMSRDFVNRDFANLTQIHGDENWRATPILHERNLAFRNRGDLQFENVSAHWGLDLFSASYGAALADLDRDGDLDLAVANFNAPVALFRNDERSQARVLIRLKGVASNSWGIGAKVTCQIGPNQQVRYLTLARGFMSADEPLVHFGCGPARQVDRLHIQWPSGRSQVFENLETGRFYTITEPDRDGKQELEKPDPPLFSRSNLLTGARHQEGDFDEFVRQPLLPFELSRLGPGLAVGDVNGDSLDDFYLSGAAGFSGLLMVRQPDGSFARRACADLEKDRACEDMGALFFDADQDGDIDLYVVSGGVECEPEAALLQDRLYLNDGQGGFTRAAKGILPEAHQSGSIVCAADFDRDGDLDLFVGGRSIPGKYPATPTSRLLRNQGKTFEEITDSAAPGLKQAGLITSAVWSDANNDGWVDLLVTREWGSIMVFLNREGQLVDETARSGLAEWRGFWNSLAGCDVDNDGDLDYVAGNLGLNTAYRASPNRPTLLYFGDLQARGEWDLLEAGYEGDKLFPMRGKTTLTDAMPALFAQIATFAEFGRTTVPDILGPDQMKRASQLAVTTLESGVLLNDGHARFQFRPFPRAAQVAPVYGLAVADWDADGRSDLCLLQNFSGPRVETGRMNGGVGLLLKGIGHGHFQPVGPAESGLLVEGDGRALGTVDLNQDGWPDLIATENNGPAIGFTHRGGLSGQILAVRLKGTPGNSSAVGARVEAAFTGGSRQTGEVYAGGGYLSQSPPEVYFGLPEGQSCAELRVRWPDGTTSTHRPEAGRHRLILRQGP